MGIGTGIAIYFVIWWTTLFISLPFRMYSQAETGAITDGTEPGAPVAPQIGRRMLWNTVLAAFVFFLYWLVVYQFGIGVDSFPEFIPIRKVNG